ncbi:uncharacterized protein LOC125943813 [Dermacentor silvarum]|uniref:uncharacterized protein LOC125943813 n=1 Tax=Dermacentor silvarum TaxID=543639 RepID=UPI002100D6CD|nr:uncharacterized protein LOC125943813 [Dermacentor silvarum]
MSCSLVDLFILFLNSVESSPDFTPPPMTSTTDDERNVAIRWPDSPAHNMNAAEPRHSAENFRLPCSVTLRRRRATKSMSPVAFSEFSPINATERVELNPAQATEDEAEESDADEGPWNTASCSGRASTVPKFMSPDMTAYPRLIREDIAKCYDAHREWPSSLMDSPASTVSAASDEHNVASSPTAAIPVASKLTPDEDLARLSAYNPSPIFRPMLDIPHRLSTVMECTETSIKGSPTTAHDEDEAGILHELEKLMALLNEKQAAGAGITAASPQATAEEAARPISPIPRRVELNPAQATEDEAEESDADEGPWNTASCSGRASTVPKFMSPDMTAYPRLIREDIAKCYDAHREWPSSLMDSPASTVSAASDEHNVASSPTAAIPVASKLTPDEDLGRLSAYNPSPIFRPMLDIPHRLSTVIECTETSIKGSPTTTHVIP